MTQGVSEFEVGTSVVASELDPYRQLIELQKEIVRLAEHNERAKRHCTALRNQVATNNPTRTGTPRTFRQKANRVLRPWAAAPIKSYLGSLVMKEQQTC